LFLTGIIVVVLIGIFPNLRQDYEIIGSGVIETDQVSMSLAAVSFDQTGTTKIGKYLLNHSFMLPGLVTMVSAVIIALLLGAV
jgi:anaerobic C4-dicarboxylate transporter